MFNLQSSYKPAGDQITAIDEIIDGFSRGEKNVTLLGATGTGKTFTMANVIQELQVPTLIISHNKTLAAQLATEFKHFFPNNAVHYFVSYFDYYQPESYLPQKDVYIEKEATVNKEIEMYRLATMASLLTRKDVIVVASVSALYGLGKKEFFQQHTLFLETGVKYDFQELKRQLISMQYKPVQSALEAGMFDFRGDMLDIFSSTERIVYRLHFNDDLLELITVKDSLTFQDMGVQTKITLWPSNQYVQDVSDVEAILKKINSEMEIRGAELKKSGKEIEAQRLLKKVSYDMRMIKEMGFVNGIENYSLYFDGRMAGEPPNTIFDYFPEEMLMIMDESHMSIPQMRAMPEGDKSRKKNLIDHGFRLPSAIDHRPLNFGELEKTLGWKELQKIKLKNQNGPLTKKKLSESESREYAVSDSLKAKQDVKTIFVSATPSQYEMERSNRIVEQIIRPTGLLDPFTYVYPKSGDFDMLVKSMDTLLSKKPYLQKFLDGYEEEKVDLKEVFVGEEE